MAGAHRFILIQSLKLDFQEYITDIIIAVPLVESEGLSTWVSKGLLGVGADGAVFICSFYKCILSRFFLHEYFIYDRVLLSYKK